jgi:hypothetical protein
MVNLGGWGRLGGAGRAGSGRWCRGVAAVADLERPWEAGDALRDRAMIPYTDDDSAWVLDEAVVSLVRLRAPLWLGDARPTVSVLVSLAGEAESLLFDAVASARDQGYTWDQIASRLATTTGTARRRYAAYVRWAARPVFDAD